MMVNKELEYELWTSSIIYLSSIYLYPKRTMVCYRTSFLSLSDHESHNVTS